MPRFQKRIKVAAPFGAWYLFSECPEDTFCPGLRALYLAPSNLAVWQQGLPAPPIHASGE